MLSSQTPVKKKKQLPLPTAQENDAMIGQTLWEDSTGKGLEPLARRGEQKLKAIKLAERQEDGTDNAPAFISVGSDANKTSKPKPHLRTIEEQNAITGKIFWPESTGKDTLPLANKVEMRERVAAARPPLPTTGPTLNQTRQDRLKARTDRATAAVQNQKAARDQGNSLGGLLDEGKEWVSKQANQAAGWVNSKLAETRHDLMNGPIDDTLDASARYLFGDGSEQELSDDVKNQFMNHENVQWQIEKLKNGTAGGDPRVDLDFEKNLSSDTFHLGRTKVYYNEVCEGGVCTTTFRGPYLNTTGEADGYEDPYYFGAEPGKPYKYKQFEWQVSYPDPRQNKQKK